ncbi:16S rRNA (guanine(966)-N(2))-methyltransferase RsmD [Lachnospira multipara]|jgi:16S rRNA (guanine966-N2)-methyltransferase|uniref:16S rRNA (guanine(966)-N(2))-methyltransferase RsmD n=1 Tax=Lachnospira multipara TaxID=28051 RepID=UPI0004E234F1|nr:16S rRNA (guanine(966)-N(2))-methyltransferase RsmD [Lachnospira multipara]
MRVIAGSARHLPLKTIEGPDTRPTTDRIKETLFNILQSDISGSNFLDLYSGSGAIAIEALSRGARSATLVESSKNACKVIKENLEFTKLAPKANLMECDCLSAINRLKNKEVFDIIFMDPPYGKDFEYETLKAIKASNIADEYTIIIIEEKLDTNLDYAESLGFELVRAKTYKTNKHLFYKLKGDN